MSAAALARQLRSVQTILQYQIDSNAGRNDWLTDRLAELLDAAGVRDIREIGRELRTVKFTATHYETKIAMVSNPAETGGESEQRQVVAVKVPAKATFEVFFNRRTFADLPSGELLSGAILFNYYPHTVRDPLTQEYAINTGFIARIYDKSRERFYFDVFIRYIGEGIPFFFAVPVVVESGGALRQFFSTVAPAMPVISVALAVLAPGIGLAIGQAVLGATAAAAYPMLATAIGNAAIGTILSGGNVKAGVMGAVAGFAGGAIGGTLAKSLNSELVGVVAARAASTAIVGGDVKEAAKNALLQTGATSLVKG